MCADRHKSKKMKNYIKHKWIFTGLLSIIFFAVYAQPDWNTNGNNITGGEWFGADNASTIPLEIRHDANNQQIDFLTNAVRRMRIGAGNATAPTTGTATAGFVGIGPHPSLYSRLTISNIATGAVGGYRPWMQTGVFSIENSDNTYMGRKKEEEEGTDRSNAVSRVRITPPKFNTNETVKS